MIPEPQLGDRGRSLSVFCAESQNFLLKEGDAPRLHLTLRQLLFLNFNSDVCTSKIPTVREQLEQREQSLQHTLSSSPPLSRDP